jgi:hypothetical protein
MLLREEIEAHEQYAHSANISNSFFTCLELLARKRSRVLADVVEVKPGGKVSSAL